MGGGDHASVEVTSLRIAEFSDTLDWRPMLFPEPITAQKACFLCGVVYKKAVRLSCNHRLCTKCYTQCVDKGGICPVDQEPFCEDDVEQSEVSLDYILKRKPMDVMPGPPVYAMPTSAAITRASAYQYALPTNALSAQAPAYQHTYQTAAPVAQGTTSLRRVTSLSQLYSGTVATAPAYQQYQYAYPTAAQVSQSAVSVERFASQPTLQIPAMATVQYTQYPTVPQVCQEATCHAVSRSQIYRGGGAQVPATPAHHYVHPTLSRVPRRRASVTRVTAQVATSATSPG
ncbi:hypothetical protein HPB47_017142 [Ixodes persulcatus]|uniref:Uncharacterized protein n=1 Tax=Ixodes persulcatus TaxID=34615 RepID=A0AC60QQ40_IXOPE|nr:hypothetical protein HPB47_017142 [Ixodes persulcatus]